MSSGENSEADNSEADNSDADNLEADDVLPEIPQGPLSVTEDCWMVGHRNPGSMLQCNTYLRSFTQFGSTRNVCIDPGSRFDYSVIKDNIAKLVGDVSEIHAMTINHQDPDVAGNAPQFCDANPDLEMIVSEEVWRLLQHMMLKPGKLRLSHGKTESISTRQPFQFIPTPFCHFRGAMALYDPEHRILYSGDLFGGLNRLGVVHLLATEDDWSGIAQFHQIYMPSREVLRYAVREILSIRPKVEIIAPQHGHIITGDLVGLFLERMHELLVGSDLMAEEWDAENLSGYREVLQYMVDCAIEERGELNVTGRINAQEVDDELRMHLRLRQGEVVLEREGYSAVAKTFARLAEGEPEEYVALLRGSVFETCEQFGLPVPPAAAGWLTEGNF
jgi:glyoxylase-like metal-dependent hydrolase (beta-lactamase superfamily II)